MKENCFYFCRNKNELNKERCFVDVRIINPGMKSLLYSKICQYNVVGLFSDEKYNFLFVTGSMKFGKDVPDYYTFRIWLGIFNVDFEEILSYLTDLGFETDVVETEEDWPDANN